MNRYQTKGCNLETKVDAAGRRIMGYFAAFGNKDSDGDIILPGAFAKSISERGPQSAKPRILFLRDHDSSKVIGRIDLLREDTKGLYYEATLASTPLGDETLELAKMGALTEHSIGYQTVKSKFDQKAGANLLEEIKLWEGSLVPWGANEQTPVVGIKAFKAPEGLAEQIDALAKQTTDEDTKSRLSILAQQLKAEQEEALADKGQPDEQSTEPTVKPLTEAELKALISELNLIKDAFGRQ